jgi:pimeloyl-ACP methyl ester carboxylesterase
LSNAIVEKTGDLSLGRIRWLEAGQGKPLLLLHGMGMYSSAGMFTHLIPLLAPRMRVIAPDLLGFGKGVRTMEEGPTFDLMLEHLREFMDVQEIASAGIVGHSMGGWVAALFAHQSPSRVERLMMLCAAGMNQAPASGIRHAHAPTEEELVKTFQGSYWNKDQADPAAAAESARIAHEIATRPGALEGIDPLLRQMETPAIRARYMLQRRLPFLKMPVMMVWGEGDQMDPYPTWNKEWAEHKGDPTRSSKPWAPPGAKFRRLPTGHFPQIENPRLTADTILEFFG